MTRAILAGLFTPEEALRHAAIIREALLFPDGVRLMSEPATYRGGVETLFRRADTAANFGREIGLQYVHAHLRYAQAMAVLGDAQALWTALQLANPVGLREVLPQAGLRQANAYFSSSDAAFDDRMEAARHWGDLRAGAVPVRGGWRVYSSGPGLFLHTVRSSLLGIRESFGDLVLDPVLPASLDGLCARTTVQGVPLEVHYRVGPSGHSPRAVAVNGSALEGWAREPNPYRSGGVRITGEELRRRLAGDGRDRILVEL